MSKRKRQEGHEASPTSPNKAVKVSGQISIPWKTPTHIQIITGSYERILHGITATLTSSSDAKSSTSVQFVDTFLFNAHSSSIRSLALSPLPEPADTDSPKVILATGGSDERINLYHLSARPAWENEEVPSVPTLAGNKIMENPKNREIGSLMHHSSSITSLYFPTRSKLLSAAEDNEISVTRTKDWSVVSTIRAPRPKAQGRPSGDTAPPGAFPAGINDFAVHPSMKLMVSVGKGERCMRLWNLVTGKKAGVLSFAKDILQSILEGKYSSGEGRRIAWNPDGEDFTIAFERGAIIYGTDSKPKSRVLPSPLTKLHQMRYFSLHSSNEDISVLAVSTEDGRILFYDTDPTSVGTTPASSEQIIPEATLKGQLGGKQADSIVRIKDFEILGVPSSDHNEQNFLIVAGSSDGTIKLWTLEKDSLLHPKKGSTNAKSDLTNGQFQGNDTQQIGKLLDSYETGNRITCLTAFVMLPTKPDEEMVSDSEESFEGFDESSSGSDAG
ncbi:MAG: hypothetical protein Q9227_003313 [Pyrenula ochraceoflavens]